MNRKPETRPNRLGGHSLKLNAGGVCDNCGLPRLAHDGENCPDGLDDETERRVNAWGAIVDPAREKYQAARKHHKNCRTNSRKGKATAEEVETATREQDQLLVEYRAAIRRGDREVDR